MLISLHIPKTAGTAFRLFVERNVGNAVAFDYVGAASPDAVMERARAGLAQGRDRDVVARQIQGAGVELVHGHHVADFYPIFPDAPAIAFLREPLARAVSEYLTLKRGFDPSRPDVAGLVDGSIDFEEFLTQRAGFQARCVTGLREGGRDVALFVAERTHDAAVVFHDALDWRGVVDQRNVRARKDDAEARALIDAWGHDRETLLGRDTELYREALDAWNTGAAQLAARAVLARGPRRRRPSVLPTLRRAAGVVRERFGRALGRDWR